MSHENVELVQAAFAAYFENDESSLREVTASDITITTIPDRPDFRDYHGFEGLIHVLGDWVDIWDDYAVEVTRMWDVGDFVFVAAHQRGKGKRSGVPIDEELVWVITVRGRQIHRLQMFPSEQQALNATGLAMSPENVEVVERAIAAINARDIDTYLACCTEDVVLRTPMAEITGVYEGAEGIRRFLLDVEDSAPDFQLGVERVESTGANQVLAFLQVTASGRSSGIRQDAPSANVYDLVGGRISRIRIFLDRRQALEAVGLEE
ncbi:MAG TPA: nuclear transport factor 2 family protein [Solirubrobacteraceae bacterium]|jgi:ketosteroid isomerase-like protein